MSPVLDFFDHQAVFTFALGTIFGMIVWDLAIEARPSLKPDAVRTAGSYYKCLHTAHPLVALVLPAMVLVALTHVGLRIANGGGLRAWSALVALSVAFAVEVLVALPEEKRLIRRLKTAGEADDEAWESMRACVRKARNAHLAIGAVVLAVAFLVGHST